jgi:hypothetical protein
MRNMLCMAYINTAICLKLFPLPNCCQHERQQTRDSPGSLDIGYDVRTPTSAKLLPMSGNYNVRFRACIRYRRSDVRHRMFSLYFDLQIVRYCIQHRIQHRIRHRIRQCNDIVCDVHSIGFGAGFRGFKLHARSRRHRSLHGNVFIQTSTAPPAAGSPAPSPPLSAAAARAAAAAAAGAADSSSSSSPDMVKLWE